MIGSSGPGHQRKAVTAGLAEVYLSPTTVDFYPFNEDYLRRLKENDPETTTHFFVYFRRLLRTMLRSRKLPDHVIEEVTQETFLRALTAVKNDVVRDAACFGAFVNRTCKNVLREYYRDNGRYEQMDGNHMEIPSTIGLEREMLDQEMVKHVRAVLATMPQRDQAMLTALLEERDKDEICREHGVTRDYLRVLMYRARKAFKNRFSM